MIVSFYSYKGGVGRSQLLANLAAYYCYYENKTVLLIDWDLEAPGLHYYFGKDAAQNKGLIELLLDYCAVMEQRLGSEIAETEIEQLFKTNLPQYIVPNIAQHNKARIDLMTAGLYDDTYSKKTNGFDWVKFYENLDGGFFIELLKKYLKDLDYDYIFIDSRTGVSDYSGICNIQMPDANVIVIAPSKQNVQGSLKVANNIANAEYITKHQRRFPIIFPILSRLDPLDDHQKSKWIKSFRSDFTPLITQLIGLGTLNEQATSGSLVAEIEQYIADTLLEYKTDLSYGEQLLFGKEQEKLEKTTLAYQIKQVATWINSYAPYPNMDKLPIAIAQLSKGITRFDIVKKQFEQWTKANPDARNLLGYAVFLHEHQRYQAALTQYELAENYISEPKQLLKLDNNKALVYKKLQQTDKAIELFDQLLAQNPQNADMHFNRASLWQARNKPIAPNEAISYYTNAITLYQKQGNNANITHRIAQAYQNQAACYALLQQWDKVENNCMAALKQYQELPDTADTTIKTLETNLALALLIQKKYVETLQYGESLSLLAESLIKHINDDDPDFYTITAKELNEQKQYDAAIKRCTTILSLYPNNATAYFQRGRAYTFNKQYQQAIADFNKAIQIDPNFAYAYNNRGIAYRNLNQYQQAIDDFNKAIQIDPNYTNAYNNRGIAYSNLQEYQQAIADFNKAIQIDPNDAKAYYNRGNAYGNLQQYQQAINDYNKAIQIDPNDAKAYNNRGIAYSDLQQYEQAIANYNKAIQINPNDAYAYYFRGIAYYDLQRYQQAIADFSKAIQIDPNYAKAYNNRGNAYIILQQYQQAIADYQKALSLLSPSDPYYAVVQDAIKKAQALIKK